MSTETNSKPAKRQDFFEQLDELKAYAAKPIQSPKVTPAVVDIAAVEAKAARNTRTKAALDAWAVERAANRKKIEALGVNIEQPSALVTASMKRAATKTPAPVTPPPASPPAGGARPFLKVFDAAYAQTRQDIDAGPAALAKLKAARAALDMTQGDMPAGFRTFIAKCDHHIAQAEASGVKYSELRALNALAPARQCVSPQ